MFKNSLKVAVRNLQRNKMFSALNILGLSVGLASTMLIMMWVLHEKSWDNSIPDKERIYHVMAHRNFNNELVTSGDAMFPLAETLKQKFPEIESAAVTGNDEEVLLTFNENSIRNNTLRVSPDFLDVFKMKFVEGSAATALSDPNSLILTASAARTLTGSSEPAVNKIIRIDNRTDARITAVVEDIPANSTVRFSALLPFNHSDPWIRRSQTDWVNCFFRAYIKVRSTANEDLLNARITALVKDRNANSDASYFVHPLSKWHLYSEFKDGKNTGGMIDYVRLFTIVAIIILAIACINFMNLSTARAGKRAREVGIRKTIGSNRSRLLGQFFTESVFLSLIAFAVAVGMVYIAYPYFVKLVGQEIHFGMTEPSFFLTGMAVAVVTGLISGSYPALYLSSFAPVKVLKGVFVPGKNAIQPRKVLVTLQFAISILLITATIVVYQQINHVKNRHLGYKPDDMILIRSSADVDKNFDVIREELLSTGLVANVSRSTSPVTQIYNYTGGLEWKGMKEGANLVLAAVGADAGFFETINAKILEGRDFSRGSPADSSAMILNKAAVEAMGLESAVGTSVRYGSRSYEVIAVTDNIVMASPYKPVEPMMTLYSRRRSSHVTVRLQDAAATEKSIAALESIFKKHNPAYPFEYRFVDEEFNRKFITEELIGNLTNTFAALAIFICCLGLFGLAAFSAEQRKKEIGIRKVLGAELSGLIGLLSKEFIRLVIIASVIAFPIAWWGLNSWLDDFPYRVSISAWVFILAGLSAILIALATVSTQAVKAGTANPVKSLRSE